MTKKFMAIPMVAVALGLSAGAARAAEPTTSELMQQINQLQAKVQQLETKQEAMSSKDVDETVNKVLQDADKRSELLQMEGFTAGWQQGKGFRIQDAAGNFVLHPFFQFDFRATSNWRQDGKHAGADNDWNNGFEVRRLKLGFDGNAFSPDFYYYFRWNTSNTTGGLNLEEAWARYFFSDDWAIRAGQITNPVFHEQVVSSSKLLTVERSLVNQLITGANQAYTQEVSLIYSPKNGPITGEVGLEDGFNSVNTDFLDPTAGGTNDWGAFGRVNWFVMGDRKEYDDFTAMGNKTDLLVIGGGIDITQTNDVTTYLHTVDAQYENTNGLGVYGAYYGNYTDDTGADNTNYDWGFLAQAGYMLNSQWEVFGQYDFTNLDSAPAGLHDTYHEMTVGVNYYIQGHAAKITIDGSYLPNGSPTSIEAIGALAGQDNQLRVRAQFQLLL
jgi:phosphate-selective porin OprO/OprP